MVAVETWASAGAGASQSSVTISNRAARAGVARAMGTSCRQILGSIFRANPQAGGILWDVLDAGSSLDLGTSVPRPLTRSLAGPHDPRSARAGVSLRSTLSYGGNIAAR